MGVRRQSSQGATQPPGQQRTEQQTEADQPGAVRQQPAFRAIHIRLQRAVGLGHSDHADDLAVVANRRADVHHRRPRIVRVIARGACAVFATQGQVDVVPARVILPHRRPAGVQHDEALGVGDVDAVVDLILWQAPDFRSGLSLTIGLEQFRPAVLVEAAGLEVVAQDLGHQVGGIDQGFFGGLAHAGADLLHDRVEHKVAGQADEQCVDQENPDSQRHQLCPGL
ncbi:hypothetical protein D3C85_792590 [compost metagenome]